MFSSSAILSNSSSNLSEEAALLSSSISVGGVHGHDFRVVFTNPQLHPSTTIPAPPLPLPQLHKIKKKRSLPGNPDPDAEVIALSPKSLLATNRFVCEACNKGFQRDQNLQLHRRGHNLPWKLKQRDSNQQVRKKVYVCPEPTCVHHHPSRALGDLTGIKKHFCRKHGEKKWKCGKCSKIYAVHSDWKAHSKMCGTQEYRCDCGTIFSRKDSFITHRAFCDALAEESARIMLSNQGQGLVHEPPSNPQNQQLSANSLFPFPCHLPSQDPNLLESLHLSTLSYQNPNYYVTTMTSPLIHTYRQYYGELADSLQNPALRFSSPSPAHLSATGLLQKTATIGTKSTTRSMELPGHMAKVDMNKYDLGALFVQKSDQGPTRDFLGLRGSVDVDDGQDDDSSTVIDFGTNHSWKATAQVSVCMGDQLHCTRECIGSRNPNYAESCDELSVLNTQPLSIIGYELAESAPVAASKLWG